MLPSVISLGAEPARAPASWGNLPRRRPFVKVGCRGLPPSLVAGDPGPHSGPSILAESLPLVGQEPMEGSSSDRDAPLGKQTLCQLSYSRSGGPILPSARATLKCKEHVSHDLRGAQPKPRRPSPTTTRCATCVAGSPLPAPVTRLDRRSSRIALRRRHEGSSSESSPAAPVLSANAVKLSSSGNSTIAARS